MADLDRSNGYAPVSSYAVLGDGRIVPSSRSSLMPVASSSGAAWPV
jgi:hypothetical protein